MTGTARIVVVLIALIEVCLTWQSGVGLGWITVLLRRDLGPRDRVRLQVPAETKNRSVEEITEVFEHHATCGRRAGIRLAKDTDAAAA
jgi:hypothetical protein